MRSSKTRRSSILSALAVVLGCSPDTAGVGVIDGADGGSGGASDTDVGDTEGNGVGGSGITIRLPNKKVDILFVIDDSRSMGAEQDTLTANVASFLELLERPDVAADARIAFTTTDGGNPMCPGTTPELGELVLTSCRSRAADFTDAPDVCESRCAFDNIGILPTTTDTDAEPRARPWIETRNGVSNLGESACAAGQECDAVPTLLQATQCFLPQGVSGCGFPQHLESMYGALERTGDADDPAFGFVRDDAFLSVVFVTDGADCSYNPAHESIFLPDGDRTFWSDPDAAEPTRAVCWNAAATCSGNDCDSADYDPLGGATGPDDAVMRPVDRYIEQLQAVEDDKKLEDPEREVLVALVAGAGSDGAVVYQDSADAAFQDEFGIGPGCSSAAGAAAPPLRLRELADAFAVENRNIFSVCDSDYSPALSAVANALADQIKPACMPACVADTDETTEVLDPSCTIVERSTAADGSTAEADLAPCEPGGELPEGADACYILLFDGRGLPSGEREYLSEDRSDDLSDYCAEQGWNLEVIVHRRWGVVPPTDAAVQVLCELSEDPAVDCPAL